MPGFQQRARGVGGMGPPLTRATGRCVRERVYRPPTTVCLIQHREGSGDLVAVIAPRHRAGCHPARGRRSRPRASERRPSWRCTRRSRNRASRDRRGSPLSPQAGTAHALNGPKPPAHLVGGSRPGVRQQSRAALESYFTRTLRGALGNVETQLVPLILAAGRLHAPRRLPGARRLSTTIAQPCQPFATRSWGYLLFLKWWSIFLNSVRPSPSGA